MTGDGEGRGGVVEGEGGGVEGGSGRYVEKGLGWG